MSGSECTHHWYIESPEKGKTQLEAVCKRCGAQRTFPSWPALPATLAEYRALYTRSNATLFNRIAFDRKDRPGNRKKWKESS